MTRPAPSATASPMATPTIAGRRPLPQHQAHHFDTAGTKRDPHTDLARTLTHNVRDDAVDANRCEHEGQHREESMSTR